MPTVTLVSDRGEPRIVDDILEFEALVLRGPWRPQTGTIADAYLALGSPAPVPPSPGLPSTVAELAATPELRAALGSADPVLSDFVYDGATGNLTSFKEDGIAIALTYNADGTVATSKRGDSPAKAFTYSGGNLVGVA